MAFNTAGFFSKMIDVFYTQLKDARLLKGGSHQRYEYDDMFVANEYTFNASVALNKQLSPIYNFHKGLFLSISDACLSLGINEMFFEELPILGLELDKTCSYNDNLRFIDYSNIFPVSQEHSLFPWIIIAKYPEFYNTKRGTLIYWLMDFCTKYIALHEQGHFLGGHLYYVMEDTYIYSMKEIEFSSHISVRSVDRMALELMADYFAAFNLLEMPQFAKLSNYKYMNPDVTEYFQDKKTWIRISFAAVAIITAILERADRFNETILEFRTHPSAGARFLNTTIPLIETIDKTFRTNSEKDGVLGVVIQDTNLVYQTIGSDTIGETAINEYYNTNNKEYTNKHAKELAFIQTETINIIEKLKNHQQRALSVFEKMQNR